MNTVLTNLKRVLNLRTLLSVLAVTALCFFSHIITFDYDTPPTLIELTLNALFKNEQLYTRQDIVSNFDTSYWFYIVLPVIVSMPAVADFYEEWFGGGFYLNVHRQQIFKYCVSKSVVYSINAAMILFVGAGLFIIPVTLVFPGESVSVLSEIYPDGFSVYMLMRLLNAAAAAAVCPLVTIIILILIKEKFLALSIPMLINYITAQIGNFLNIKAFTDDKPYLNKLASLLPYYQFSLSKSFEDTFEMPFWVWYTAWALAFALAAAVLFYLVKRRIRNGG